MIYSMNMSKKNKIKMPPPAFTKGDYYFNEKGRMIFTEQYHLKKGQCCKSVNGCKHCPY